MTLTSTMKTYTFQRQQIIGASLREVFSFFSRPENLALLTPKNLRFRILTPSPIHMKDGGLVEYTIRLFGMDVPWATLITHFEPPHRFVDVQLRGPYSFWHHVHRFAPTDDGTLMTDVVTYAMPMGVIGRIVRALFVNRQLAEIFSYREECVDAIFSDQAYHTQNSLNTISGE